MFCYTDSMKNKFSIATIRRFGLETALFIYDRDNRKCTECGSEYDLTIHHLDRNGRNNLNNGLLQNNDVENLVVLCRRCHGSIHGKHGNGILRRSYKDRATTDKELILLRKERNKEYQKKYNLEYRKKNKDKFKEYYKKYYQSNKVKLDRINREYALKNRDKISKYHKEYINIKKEELCQKKKTK